MQNQQPQFTRVIRTVQVCVRGRENSSSRTVWVRGRMDWIRARLWVRGE